MMEEKTCLEQHLVKMLDIHRRLTFYLDYWMTDELAVDVVLRLLPPSNKDYVRGVAMKREPFSSFTFPTRLRTTKVEPIEAEIIDPEGIFDIQAIIFFPFTPITVL